MLRYKIDVLSALKNKGYTSYKLRTDKVLSEKVMTQIRARKVTLATLERVCQLLDCQPGDLIEYIPDTPAAEDKTE